MGKFIFDDLTGEPTILATERAKRRDQTGSTGSVHEEVSVSSVIPAKAGIQSTESGTVSELDSRLRGNDSKERGNDSKERGNDPAKRDGNDINRHGNDNQKNDENVVIPDKRSADPESRFLEHGSRVKPGMTEQTSGNDSPACFFCKGNEHLTPPTLYTDEDNWNVRVVSNKYPLVADHDVIIHSPHHDKDLEDLDHEQVVRYIRALLNRVSFYGSQEKEVFIFNNRGSRAGASLTHPHSQIIALKGFPGNIQKEKEWSIRYFDEKNTCFWCDEVSEVVKEGSRVVLETKHFVAFVPKACKWSYEIRVSPKNHKPNFGFIDEQEINDFAGILQKVIQAYGRAFNAPDRNFWIHTNRYDPFHWHVGFLPHIKVFGAVELGAGIWVSDKATPEDAAKVLRENI